MSDDCSGAPVRLRDLLLAIGVPGLTSPGGWIAVPLGLVLVLVPGAAAMIVVSTAGRVLRVTPALAMLLGGPGSLPIGVAAHA